ncbi:MAG: hypothetical protein II393_01650 [Cytophagales bacterium]|nr:hypothetical protein [Cytophagales bacterium]
MKLFKLNKKDLKDIERLMSKLLKESIWHNYGETNKVKYHLIGAASNLNKLLQNIEE